MKKILLVLIFLLSGCSTSLQKDLSVVKKKFAKDHANLFENITEDYWFSTMDEIIENATDVSKEETIFKLHQLVAEVGDSHTKIYYPSDERFHFGIKCFEDDYYVTIVHKDNKDILNGRIISINNLEMDEIIRRFATVVPHESDYSMKYFIRSYIYMSYLYKMLGITDNDQITVKVEKEGVIIESVLNSISKSEVNRASDIVTSEFPGLRYKTMSAYYWSEVIDDDIMYVNIVRSKSMVDKPISYFVGELFDEVEEKKIKYLIFDLRDSSGEDVGFFKNFHDKLDQFEFNGLYGIIDYGTYSTGLGQALDLREKYNALLVGEPTGQKPNYYASVQNLKLHYKSFYATFSSQFIENIPGNNEDSLYPDVYAPYTFDNLITGSDDALDWILNDIAQREE